MSNYIGILGIIAILAIAFAFSSNRKAINLRIVGAAFALQAVIAAIVLFWDRGQAFIGTLSKGVLAIIGFANAGIDMVFGPLADTNVVGFSFAINVLPIIIFFSALMSVLYHLRVMEWVVKIVGGFLHKVIGTGAIESMNAVAYRFEDPATGRQAYWRDVGTISSFWKANLELVDVIRGLSQPVLYLATRVEGLAEIALFFSVPALAVLLSPRHRTCSRPCPRAGAAAR